jgi:hypothetical protein
MRLGCKIDCTAEDVEHTLVNALAAKITKALVKAFRTAPAQIRNAANAQVREVLREAGTDAGDAPQVTEHVCAYDNGVHIIRTNSLCHLMSFTEKAKARMPCPFPRHPDFAGMMRPGNNQSTPFLICLWLGARQGRRALRC